MKSLKQISKSKLDDLNTWEFCLAFMLSPWFAVQDWLEKKKSDKLEKARDDQT